MPGSNLSQNVGQASFAFQAADNRPFVDDVPYDAPPGSMLEQPMPDMMWAPNNPEFQQMAEMQMRMLDDYEWRVCWDFEVNGWQAGTRASSSLPWQQPAWAAKPSTAPPGPPPGPPPGGGAKAWGKASWSSPGHWAASKPNFDGPFVGDFVEDGASEARWQGQKGPRWQSGSGAAKGSGRGRGGKGWDAPSVEPHEVYEQAASKGSQKQSPSGWAPSKGERSGWMAETADAEEVQQRGGKKGKKGEKGDKGGKGAPKWQATEAATAPQEEVKDAMKEAVAAEIESVVQASDILQKTDFDFRVRRFLLTLRGSFGPQKVRDALTMINTYTTQKSRESVKNWPAYLLTLLKKFEPDPFNKSKGKSKEKSQAKPQKGKGGAAPVAASAGQQAAAAAAAAAIADDVEVVLASEEPTAAGDAVAVSAPAEALEEDSDVLASADLAALPSSVVFPPGWQYGRSALLEEIRSALAPSGGSLRCPFTSQPLDVEATLVSHALSCLQGSSSEKAGSRHFAGLAGSRAFVDCPRAAAAVAVVSGQAEFLELADDASAMNAVSACLEASKQRPGNAPAAATIVQEIAIELTADILRNPQLSST